MGMDFRGRVWNRVRIRRTRRHTPPKTPRNTHLDLLLVPFLLWEGFLWVLRFSPLLMKPTFSDSNSVSKMSAISCRRFESDRYISSCNCHESTSTNNFSWVWFLFIGSKLIVLFFYISSSISHFFLLRVFSLRRSPKDLERLKQYWPLWVNSMQTVKTAEWKSSLL